MRGLPLLVIARRVRGLPLLVIARRVRGLPLLVIALPMMFAAATALTSSSAWADTPKLAALATPAPQDARKAIAVGPQGQLYRPDGKGGWVRTQRGGTAEEVVAATSTPGAIVADAKGSALFKLDDTPGAGAAGGWTSIRLAQKAQTILGAGSRALAAAGKSVFALDGRTPAKLGDAPLPVLAVAGSVGGGVVIATAKGLFSLQGSAFKPMKNVPRAIGTLLSDRFLLVGNGVFDLKTQKTLAWPAGLKVTDTALVGSDTLLAVGVRGGKTFELVVVKASASRAKGGADTEVIPLPDASPVVGIVGDKAGRVVIATRDGHIAMRDGGKWTISEVREELPADKPGSPPAESP